MGSAGVSFDLGGARAASFNVGDLYLRLDEVFDLRADLAPYFGGRDLAVPEAFPTQSFFVAAGPLRVVVEPSDYGRLIEQDTFKHQADYARNPQLDAKL
ncbi:MAG: hypothetical protein JRN38_02975 [Nitrososphaerota archaeon]|nr:hypothetical protein [Nitrososphaerota archaeon]